MRALEEKVAIVTGSSRGIGRVIADVLSRDGCMIVINYKSDSSGATETLKLVESNNSKGLIVQADISHYEEGRELVKKAIDYFGTIDYLVNNAAAPGPQRRAEKISPEEWAETLATNITGPFYMCQHVIPVMKSRKFGRIVNMGSIVGQTGNKGLLPYATSKSALDGFTKTLSAELSSLGITVNLVCPGYIDAGQFKKTSPNLLPALQIKIPIGRFGQAEEVANTILFLLSDKAGYITGQTINVNGGLY